MESFLYDYIEMQRDFWQRVNIIFFSRNVDAFLSRDVTRRLAQTEYFFLKNCVLGHKAGQEGEGKFYWKIPLGDDDATREK